MTIVIGRQLKFVNHAMPSTTSMSPNKTQIKLPTDEVKGGEGGGAYHFQSTLSRDLIVAPRGNNF